MYILYVVVNQGATQLKNILESILWNAVKFTHQVSLRPAHASKVIDSSG